MTETTDRLEDALVIEREHWADGPPHALFKELRGGCPVHWTAEDHRVPATRPASGR